MLCRVGMDKRIAELEKEEMRVVEQRKKELRDRMERELIEVCVFSISL